MDLLDYGSSDDDSDSPRSGESALAPLPSQPPQPQPQPQPRPDHRPISILKKPPPAPLPSRMTTMTTRTTRDLPLPPATHQEHKKGKKMLSLQAVLPAHILEQLTQSQVRGGDNDDDDDDDDYDDDGSIDIHSKKRTSRKKRQDDAEPTSKINFATGKDAGIDSFLSELQHSAPAGVRSTKQSTITTTHNNKSENSNNNNRNNRGSATTTARLPSKLGAAFLTTTVVETTTTTSDQNGVRDIHSEISPPFEPNESIGRPPKSPPSAPKPTLAPAPRPNTRIAKLSLPLPPSNSVTERVTETVPPPSTVSATTSGNSKKRRRQEMERLLRQGQFDAALGEDDGGADNDGNISSRSNKDRNVFTLAQPDASMGPTDGSDQPIDTTGLVRRTATPMYDPSAGQAVTGLAASKGKGKNQIGHLLASAANLELARARGRMGGAGGNTQNPQHRANAKQKYGW